MTLIAQDYAKHQQYLVSNHMNGKNALKKLLKEYVQEIILAESVNQGRQFTSAGKHVTTLEIPSDEKKPGFLNLVDLLTNNLGGQIAMNAGKSAPIDAASLAAIKDLKNQVKKTDSEEDWKELLSNVQPILMMMTKGGKFKYNPPAS